ncbi:hypothetical protein [Kitasatospora cathayae]|uniref:Uncharacterized protein n=1 Tax=Kitasatospora cathayae TaxID=3004092 RepID=A0ABY7QB56_9ACTN|nr:hypothetical protein [Kitasatospora sp. HUAS 3-15]WBP89969.1 hypothetical protein O1G21_31745 [Kitasatospora sp. HUAS 3-15]
MGDQRDTRNEISHSTIHGNVFMGGIVSLLGGRRPRPRLLVAVVCALALLGAGTTYWALHGRTDGSSGPELSAHYDPEHGDSNTTAVVPRTVKPTELPAVTDCGGARAWSHAQGGTDVGASPLSVSMVGNGHTVAIEQVRATVVGEPRDPMPGTVVDCTGQGEGKKIDMGVDLDSTNPIALIAGPGPVSFAPYFTDRYLYLENQKPEIVSLTVLATRHSYDYVLTVEGTVDGKHHTWTVRDGDHPFRISGVRMERGTVLDTLGRGWETVYDRGYGERVRCNPCFDQDEKEIPGTAVAVAPTGYTFTSAPGADPAEPPAPPKERPAAPTPPLTVDEHDAESVGIAWAVTSGSFDLSRGDTGAAVLSRVRRYLTPELADAGGGLNACAADSSAWPAEVTAHRGWSVVMRARARPLEGHPDPRELTGDTVGLEVRIDCAYVAEDGWSHTPKGLFVALLRLQRQPGGGYLISDIGKKYDIPALTDPTLQP